MPTAFKAKSFRAMLLLGCALTVWGAVGSDVASAHGLDLDPSSNLPAMAGTARDEPNSDAAPTSALPERSAASMLSASQVQDGIAALSPKMAPNLVFALADQTPPAAASSLPPSAPPPATTMPPAGSVAAPSSNVPPSTTSAAPLAATQSAGVASSVTAEPIKLDRPIVIDTAKLRAGETIISLYGIEGQAGEPAQLLQGYLNAADLQLTCQAQPTVGFVCLLPDGTDLAEVTLINGAAQAKPDAPDAYKEQEAAAQAARRGIWVNLPPPPETLIHPMVPDTATITSNGRTYPLDGVIGLGHPYADEMQAYVTAAGDSLICSMQPAAGTYICLLPNGIDIAKVALVNGAARVAADAPDAYRVQQADALTNHRGLWAASPPEAAIATVIEPDQYAFVAGDDGTDGITYVGGAPTAFIEGEEVFLVLGAGAVGWGYYDHWHHWHGAPDHYRNHLERFHPDGRGLRGYRTEAALHRDGGFHRQDGLHREPAFQQEAAVHPGGMAPHPGVAGERPGVVNRGSMGAPAGRPGGFAGGLVRPAAAASAGGFHPAAPAARVAAPSKHH